MCSRVTRAHSQRGRGIQLYGPRWQQFMPTPGVRDGSGGLSPLLELLKAAPCSLTVGTWRKRLFGSPGPLLVLLLFSRSVVSNSLWPHGLQHPRFPCPSLSLGICSNSGPLNRICHPTISSVVPFSSFLQSFPSSLLFPMSGLFASGGPVIGASASESVLPVNIEGWFPLGLTSLVSLLSRGLSRVFSSITVWKHQFFGTQPSLWSNSNIHTWLLEKP